MTFNVLGIGYGGHDTAACILKDDKLIAAISQERLDLQKHSRAFPIDAINACLKAANLTINDINEIAFPSEISYFLTETYFKPAINNYDRIGFLINDIDRIKTFYEMKKTIRDRTGFKGPINMFLHHLCHVASAYYPSGFSESLLVSYDGMGEIGTGMIASGKNGDITILNDKNNYPNSLGLIYSAITFFLGWKHHCDEGIIMGLAPYGNPYELIEGKNQTYIEVFEEIIIEENDYEFSINKDWIAYHIKRDVWVSNKFISMFGEKRSYKDELTDHHKNIAAALQLRLETVVLNQLKRARKEFKFNKLCIAGGVGLNCSLNGKIESSGIFDEIFVQPASGDDGVTFGACLLAYKNHKGTLKPKKMHDFYKGPEASINIIEKAVLNSNITFEKPIDIYKATAEQLEKGKIVAWFQGGSEFGPRALGNRSILSKPFPASMKDHINERVKFREYFRPFAPAVLRENAEEYFTIKQESPHMLIACQVQKDKYNVIPAVVHVDGSCRVQTVGPENNKRFYKLLNSFKELTSIPVLLNTSFNVKGQPIVNTPEQAIETFNSTNIDCIVIGDFIAVK